jgi:phosphotransferase system enzyme I (PtsI)
MAGITGYGVGDQPVIGKIFLIERSNSDSHDSLKKLSSDDAITRLTEAVKKVEAEFNESIKGSKDTTLRDILSAQSALITDPELSSVIIESINSGKSLPQAIDTAINEFTSLLVGGSEEFEARIADLKEIGVRLIDAATGNSKTLNFPKDGEWIVVSNDLSPLETSKFTSAIKGVVTRDGGPTSHTAIVCRQLRISAVVGCGDISQLKADETITLDPTENAVYLGSKTIEHRGPWWANLPKQKTSVFRPLGNVGSAKDAALVKSSKALGVGLLRTELLFLDAKVEPTIEEQFKIYKEIVANCPEGEIIFRTLDAGTDKPIAFLNLGREENPALGVRGQRISWVRPQFYENQLRAIREVSAQFPSRRISIMAPMIANAQEATVFSNSARDLDFESIGVMVEVPSIIEDIPNLPESINFLSIGTNDLSQYLFAADRQNSTVAHLLNPWQPILLKTISRICELAKSRGIKVGICGEAASDRLLAPVLIGLGVESLSAGAGAVSDLVAISHALSLSQARAAAEIAINSKSANDAQRAVRNLLNSKI